MNSLLGGGDAEDEGKAEAKYEFVLLNDEARLKTAREDLLELTHSALNALPAETRALLEDAAELASARRKREASEVVETKTKQVADGLLAERGVADVLAELRPRVFVVDFDTTKEPLGSTSGKGARGAVARLEAVVSLLEATATKHDERDPRCLSFYAVVASESHSRRALTWRVVPKEEHTRRVQGRAASSVARRRRLRLRARGLLQRTARRERLRIL